MSIKSIEQEQKAAEKIDKERMFRVVSGYDGVMNHLARGVDLRLNTIISEIRLRHEHVEAIAVCFLFSFINPDHERRVGEIIAEEAPGVFVSLSHEVVPQYREYERFSTTALNAYVGPKTAIYLDRLAGHLASKGVKAGLHLMQSSGGAASP